MARRIPSVLPSLIILVLLLPIQLNGQAADEQVRQLKSEVDQLRALVSDLQSRLEVVEKDAVERRAHIVANDSHGGPEDVAALSSAAAALRRADYRPGNSAHNSGAPASSDHAADTPAPTPTTLPGGATLNFYFDGYFENNFNNPVGRVNNLRAYDVLSRSFSIGQADLVLALDPDVSSGRRYGLRLDLQYGQATETLQGNPVNEPRPDIYRNIFQAYGTYVIPLGSGLNFDFGKWASSLGIEGNYAKDQMNYTRSFYFYFLPFYHAGVRLHYDFTRKLGVNYWLVNGTNQSEPFNGYRDEMFGLVLHPATAVSWTINYHLGQEHPDTTPSTNCVVPVQPGLCLAPISPAPNGKLHIFDSYATWNATPKLTFAGEADYVIQREWANAAPGQSSAPSHADGGAAYVQYQLSPRYALAARAEYLSDRGGLFSNATQALKEGTATYRYNVASNFAAFLEYRRDWSNQRYFTTDNPAVRSTHQDTAGIGLVWWYGQKEGGW
jgi:hypothetical protein